MPMAALAPRATLDAHAINRDKVGVIGECLRKTGGIFCIPALNEVHDQLLYGASTSTLNSGNDFYSDGRNSCVRPLV
jgi:hypothetical protein